MPFCRKFFAFSPCAHKINVVQYTIMIIFSLWVNVMSAGYRTAVGGGVPDAPFRVPYRRDVRRPSPTGLSCIDDIAPQGIGKELNDGQQTYFYR